MADELKITADTVLTPVKIAEYSNIVEFKDRLGFFCWTKEVGSLSDKLGLMQIQYALYRKAQHRCFVTIFMIWDASVFLLNVFVCVLIATQADAPVRAALCRAAPPPLLPPGVGSFLPPTPLPLLCAPFPRPRPSPLA